MTMSEQKKPRVYKPLPTPLDYRKIEPQKRLQYLLKMFFWKIADDQQFVNGKPSVSYWRCRKFFSKQEVYTLNALYDYMYSLEEPKKSTMTQLFTDADRWQKAQRFETKDNTAVEPQKYKSLLECLNEWNE